MSTIVYKKGKFKAGNKPRVYSFKDEVNEEEIQFVWSDKIVNVDGWVVRNLNKYGNSALPYDLMKHYYPHEVMKFIYIATGGKHKCNLVCDGDFWVARSV